VVVAKDHRDPRSGRLAARATTDRGDRTMPRPEPTKEQIESRSASLSREPGTSAEDPEAQARALLEESEERVEDPAARDPNHPGVIRRDSDEGVGTET
jgi:hypothetical protein